MIYWLSADIVVFIHLLWILFLIFGAYWGRKNRLVMGVHGAGLILAIFLQTGGWYCPLTHIEVWLRSRQDPLSAYPGSFIGHYMEKLVYINAPPVVIFILTAALAVITSLIYLKASRKSPPPRSVTP